MGNSLDERTFMAMQVAYLTSQEFKQDEVVQKLGLKNQTEVSRLLEIARNNKWIERWHLTLSNEQLEQVEKSVFANMDELNRRLTKFAGNNRGVLPTSVHVIYNPENDHTSVEEAYRAFGKGAAPIVENLLADDHTRICAVAWGNTLKGLIDEITPPPKPKKNLDFVPLSGEPFNVHNLDYSPSAMARSLAKIYLASKDAYSLAGIAARIPKELDKHAKIIKEFLSKSDDYLAIFGDTKPLCEQLDMIITGIGDVSTSKNDHWFQETKRLEGLDGLETIAAGNIGGIWLPKDPDDKEHQRIVQDINKRWLGVREQDFRKCAKRGEARECPGVVVVAIGRGKARIVQRVMGLVNHIVMDRELAEEVLRLEHSS